jgi:hypothetical protein
MVSFLASLVMIPEVYARFLSSKRFPGHRSQMCQDLSIPNKPVFIYFLYISSNDTFHAVKTAKSKTVPQYTYGGAEVKV